MPVVAATATRLLREPDRVLDDVLRKWETVERAREIYGVVLTGSTDDETLAVDDAATRALRTQRQDLRITDTAREEKAAINTGRVAG